MTTDDPAQQAALDAANESLAQAEQILGALGYNTARIATLRAASIVG